MGISNNIILIMSKKSKSIQLIEIRGGQPSICNGGLKFLNSISIPNTNLSICTIIGNSKTGKSFFGNILTDNNTAFKVNDDMNTSTKGLWIYNKLIKVSEDNYMVLIDCQPIDSNKENDNINLKLLLLSVLISSVVIYNEKFEITNNSLQNLSLIKKFQDHFSIRTNKKDNKEFSDSIKDLSSISP